MDKGTGCAAERYMTRDRISHGILLRVEYLWMDAHTERYNCIFVSAVLPQGLLYCCTISPVVRLLLPLK